MIRIREMSLFPYQQILVNFLFLLLFTLDILYVPLSLLNLSNSFSLGLWIRPQLLCSFPKKAEVVTINFLHFFLGMVFNIYLIITIYHILARNAEWIILYENDTHVGVRAFHLWVVHSISTCTNLLPVAEEVWTC